MTTWKQDRPRLSTQNVNCEMARQAAIGQLCSASDDFPKSVDARKPKARLAILINFSILKLKKSLHSSIKLLKSYNWGTLAGLAFRVGHVIGGCHVRPGFNLGVFVEWCRRWSPQSVNTETNPPQSSVDHVNDGQHTITEPLALRDDDGDAKVGGAGQDTTYCSRDCFSLQI